MSEEELRRKLRYRINKFWNKYSMHVKENFLDEIIPIIKEYKIREKDNV